MLTLTTILEKVHTALTAIDGLAVYHYTVPDNVKAPYCEWMEDGEYNSHHADNGKQIQVLTGMVHYYTQTEFDGNVDSIQEALDETEDLVWSLNSVQYEYETNLIHYAWDFEVM